MTRLLIASAAVAVWWMSSPAFADQVPIDVSAECTTPGTGADGVRHDCITAESRLSAPQKYVIAEKSINIKNYGRGSYHDCYHRFADYVEIIPGTHIEQPRTMYYSAKAMGPTGHGSGSGDVRCHITGFYTKYR